MTIIKNDISREMTKRMFRRQKKVQKISPNEQMILVDELFSMLSEKILDGFVLKIPCDMGELSVASVHNYRFQEDHAGLKKRLRFQDMGCNYVDNREFVRDVYFIQWKTGGINALISYWWETAYEWRKKIFKRVKEGKKIFSYDKE